MAFHPLHRPPALPRKRARESPLPGPAPRLAPEFHRLDTLVHPLGHGNPANPGTVIIAVNDPDEWTRTACGAGTMLENVEARPSKGLLNLTARGFATRAAGQALKRELQRAVTSVATAHNELAARVGAPLVTIHENHWHGDGAVYESRKLPRIANGRDYDYYHTLGATHSEAGRMLPHYHLEFSGPLSRALVAPVLESLRRIGLEVLGREILGIADIDAVLRGLPEGKAFPGLDTEALLAARPRLPGESSRPAERARTRDVLESAFVALSSANTEALPLFLRNAHMNSYRPHEPALECFSAGHTSLADDLAKIEKAPVPGHGLDVGELMAMHQGFRAALGELDGYEGGSPEERAAFATRLRSGMDRAKALLAGSLPAGR